MRNYKKISSSVLMLAFIAGCVPKLEKPPELMNIPKKFTLKNTSNKSKTKSSIAEKKWSEYFSDPKLVGLIEQALNNNFDLKMAFQKIEMAKASAMARKNERYPSLGILGVSSLRRFGKYTMDGAGNSTTEIYNGSLIPINLEGYTFGIQANWEADLWGRLSSLAESAKFQLLYSQEGKNFIETNLVAEVASAYYELRFFEKRIAYITDFIKLQKQALKAVKIQREVGVVTELAVKQFKAQLLDSKSMLAETIKDRVESEAKIQFLTGAVNKSIKFPDHEFEESKINDLDIGIPTKMLKLRPDVRQAQLAVLISKADLSAAEAAFYPALNIQGILGLDAFRSDLLLNKDSLNFSFAGALIQPLINRAAIEEQFKLANAAQIEALLNYQKVIVAAFIEVNAHLAQISSLKKMHSLKDQQVKILEESVTMANELFRIGRSTYLELLLVRENVLEAKLNLLDTQQAEHLTSISLYRALGGGWSDNVKVIKKENNERQQ